MAGTPDAILNVWDAGREPGVGADHVEHISARHIPDADWHDLLPDLGIGPAERPRFAAAQRTYALRWLAVLWKQRIARAEEFDTQLRRVRMLQHDDWSA
ncbi:hypothetical protein [Nonomuraea sp. NPDC049480]|uniref:hypothetical protein n=1 Tax=Nonomuraea sp. NPDC049480 TaxID=3364353 RepID=UPI00379990C5